VLGGRSVGLRRTSREPRGGPRALRCVALSVAVSVAPAARAAEVETWEEAQANAKDGTRFQPGYEKLPVAWSQRPLTMPQHLFELEFLLSARGAAGPPVDILNAPAAGTDPTVLVGFTAGVRYGVTDGSEVVLRPPGLLFQDGVLFTAWSIGFVGRVVRLPVFELGLAGTFVPQSLGGLRFGGAVPTLFRFGPRARLDVTPGAAVVFRAAGPELDTRTEFALALQLARTVRLGPRVALSSEATRRFDVELGLEGVYTFTGRSGASVDLTVGFAFPRAFGTSRAPGTEARFEAWLATAGVRIFLPAERWL
jgi:hypothetical protein